MSKKPFRLVLRDGFTVLELGTAEIWDGADMALLRETLTRLIKAEKHLAIGVDMTFVKYIPSGFFGMLFDWFETGVQIRLYTPQPNVRKMLWFNQFFEAIGHECFELAPQPEPSYETGYSANGASGSRARRVETKKSVARTAQ
jgi:anti-anti-sigma regulatory factor